LQNNRNANLFTTYKQKLFIRLTRLNLSNSIFAEFKTRMMVIFINDIPVRLVAKKEVKEKSKKKFDTLISSLKKVKNISDLKGKVLFPDADHDTIRAFFSKISTIKSFGFKSVTFWVEDMELAMNEILKQYKIVDAAGGVILNNKGKVLMIYRLGKWDLPKGKTEKKESLMETAEREVEEECNIKVDVLDDFIISYHTYLYKNQRVLKRTFWYKMNLICDKDMQPQKEEDIEEIKWMNRKQMHKALMNSYSSITWVLNKSLKKELQFS
jgi:8-oxo-dGTP pyrophosphatase MutT (NUDIX family)